MGIDTKLLAVEKAYPEFCTGQSLIRMNYDGAMWVLEIGLPGITEAEIESIQYGGGQISFAELSDTLFFVAKLGDTDWFDTPFEPAFFKEPQDYPEFEPGTGVGMIFLISDTNTGVLKGIRLISLSNTMSNELHKVCRDMDKRHRPASLEEHKMSICEVYAMYQDSKSMLIAVEPQNTTYLEGAGRS